MGFDDHAFLTSGLLNILAFLYGLIYLIAKNLYRHKKGGTEYTCGCNDNTMAKFCHTVAKSFLNISAGTGLLGTSMFILATSRVCYSPFLASDYNTTLAVSLTLTMCVFNLVLTLLTETITSSNIHEIPLHGVKMLLCVSIMMKKENAISGVIVLFMFGSIVADQLMNLYSLVAMGNNNNNHGNGYPSNDYPSNNERSPASRRWLHLFRISMHVLCNFTFPILALFTTAWFSQEQFFNMATSSIIIFFFSATFFVVCNGWRFAHAWKELLRVTREEELDREKIVRMTAWCANTATVLVSAEVKDSKSLVLSPHGVYDNVVEMEEGETYGEGKDTKVDIPVGDTVFEDINLID